MRILIFIAVLVCGVLTATAQSENTSRLTGTVYDTGGAVIPGAKVSAKVNGKVVEVLSGNEGNYMLTLSFHPYPYKQGGKLARYDITVERPGFKTSVTKDYLFVPSTLGRMSLDVALEPGSINY